MASATSHLQSIFFDSVHLEYQNGTRVSRHPFHAFLFPCSCKYSCILPLIRRAAAASSATPARLGIKKRESAKRRLPSCKTGTLAGVALSCISFDPKGVWLLRNLPPQSALLLYVYFIISILVCKAVCCFLTVAENAYCFR